jgi:IclR family pca regulon transcriptional regulator
MGRVLLAALPPEELDRYFERAEIVAMTPRTITDPARLRRMLAAVKANGYALVDQELEEGLIALAVPLHDVSGKVIAAMNVTTHAYRADLHAIQDRYLPPLRAAAQLIDDALRSAPWVH